MKWNFLITKSYIYSIKRPISIFGAILGLVVLSPVFICTIIVLFFANKNGYSSILYNDKKGDIP